MAHNRWGGAGWQVRCWRVLRVAGGRDGTENKTRMGTRWMSLWVEIVARLDSSRDVLWRRFCVEDNEERDEV